MRDYIDTLFGDLRDELGWDDETCLGLLAGFILSHGILADEAREYLLGIAAEERDFAHEPDPIDTPDRHFEWQE